MESDLAGPQAQSFRWLPIPGYYIMAIVRKGLPIGALWEKCKERKIKMTHVVN